MPHYAVACESTHALNSAPRAAAARCSLRHGSGRSRRAMRVDPIDMLFGVQLGGGTDVNKSVG